MHKLIELDEKKYDEFVKNHPTKSHFLQSYAWGEFAKAKKNLTPYYVGLVDEQNQVIAATLLLQKHLLMGYSYLYAPRGFVLDFTQEDTFYEMTRQVIKFAKSKKAIFVKIDPDIIRREYNYLEEEVPLPYNSEKIFKMILKCGFRHLGFTKNFETMQPRYTFRIDLNQDMEEIENHFSKTTKQRINKSIKLETEVKIGTEEDLDTFCSLMLLTENRKDFASYTSDYYKTLYKIFNKNNKAILFLGSVNLEKICKSLEEQLHRTVLEIESFPQENLSKSAKNKLKEALRQKESLDKELKEYRLAKEKYGKEVTISAHMIIIYNDKAWVLYAGNHDILSSTYANYHTYYEHIKYCKENGIKMYDQFGTIGDLRPDNSRIGLHEFKKKFGGDYVEFLGEFDYIIHPLMYFGFTKLVPLYRKLKLKKTKIENKNAVKNEEE